MEMWAELAEDDKDFQYEFNKLFDNPAIKESDEEFAPDSYGTDIGSRRIQAGICKSEE